MSSVGYWVGAQLMRPIAELTENVLPEAVYFEHPKPWMQKFCEPQSTENELESKSKAHPVLELLVRSKVSVLPLTTQLSLALLQMGQAYCWAGDPELPAEPSLSTTPPQALRHRTDQQTKTNPGNHRTTPHT
jgi:hypothetical protein